MALVTILAAIGALSLGGDRLLPKRALGACLRPQATAAAPSIAVFTLSSSVKHRVRAVPAIAGRTLPSSEVACRAKASPRALANGAGK